MWDGLFLRSPLIRSPSASRTIKFPCANASNLVSSNADIELHIETNVQLVNPLREEKGASDAEDEGFDDGAAFPDAEGGPLQGAGQSVFDGGVIGA